MYLTWDVSYLCLGPELMITQQKVLCMEMLFLSSRVIIIIVTNLAWETVSQDPSPWLYGKSYISPRDVVGNLFFLANLVLKLSQDVCLGKGSGGTLTTLRYPFYLFSAASWEVYKVPLKLLRWVVSCPLLMSMSQAFSVTFTLKKIYTKFWVTETVFGPRIKSSPSETTNLTTPFTVSSQEQPRCPATDEWI